MKNSDNKFLRGSEWRCWDLHIHTPFSHTSEYAGATDDEKWNNFFEQLELISERIKVIGINDYLFLDGYKKVLEHKKKGNLQKIELILPVVEFRLKEFVGSGDLKRINYHIIFADNSIITPEQIEAQFLNQLNASCNLDANGPNTTSWAGVVTPDSLIDLGEKIHTSTPVENRTNNGFLEIGFNNINYELSGIEKALGEGSKPNTYLKDKYIKAIGKAEWESFRWDSCPAEKKNLINKSHFIFSASPTPEGALKGKKSLFEQGVNSRLLHCSDAHQIAKNLNDTKPKELGHCFTWIKADPTFEGLRQVVMDSDSRIFLGDKLRLDSMPSYTIDHVEIKNAPWLKNNSIPLNSGLITIIGARGSGKTALADLIAVGGCSMKKRINDTSFVRRAEKLFKDENVILSWCSGPETNNQLSSIDYEDLWDSPKVEYLSQQFVEHLCAADGPTNELMKEIERVIFAAHKPEDRKEANCFDDLLELELSGLREARIEFEEQVKDLTKSLNLLRDKKANLPSLQKILDNKRKAIEGDKKDRQALMGNIKPDVLKEYETISNAVNHVGAKLEAATRKQTALISLQENITNLKNSGLPSHLRKLKEQHGDTGLTQAQWDNFQLNFSGNVDGILSSEIEKIKKESASIRGHQDYIVDEKKLNISLMVEKSDPLKENYNLLKTEQGRLEKVIGMNEENAIKIKKISDKIAQDEMFCVNLEKEIKSIESSGIKMTELVQLRRSAYTGVFETILKHEKILEELYKPLMTNLENEKDTLSRLTFYVQRKVNIDQWTKDAEEDLLDLRSNGIFRGKGELHRIVKEELLPVLQAGSSQDVASAISEFWNKYKENFDQHCPSEQKKNPESFRKWRAKVSEWLINTDHISIKYGIRYNGLEIQQLSPGTRGILLLLLYLAIDKEDYRPLIIDQPEENLDPKSIFDELVTRFRSAKLRRQIIIVTHNANLVVNTDADQVIVASCDSHEPNRLPNINYISGSLENPEIREKVCEILEGGEKAFKERAKRLRVSI
jgi:hypothetical protein